jgi:prepilin-type N-terminal cleavage/methylation domain-containing protein
MRTIGSVRQGSRNRSSRKGFTLLETLMALVIIGVGVLAFVDAQASFSRTNAWSSQAATGMLLANEIREMTRRLPRHDPVTGLTLVGTGPSASVVGWGRESGEVTVDDIDDLDDLDGMSFGLGGTLPGPVDAFGNIVPEIDPDGNVVLDEKGDPKPLTGWSQHVTVEKVDPYNFNTVRAPNYEQLAVGAYPSIPVDHFPLRVTVTVQYQGLTQSQPMEVTRLTWIVFP